jgi:NACHT domain
VFASSTIIEEIKTMHKREAVSLAMFYHDFREDQKRDFRGLLASLLFQLCDQSDFYIHILSTFYLTHCRGAQSPGDDELTQCLKDLLEFPGQAPVYLIIDALDECPNTSAMPSPREQVLELLVQLIESRLTSLYICVTSRPETDIKVVLQPLTFRSVSIHEDRGQLEDIENYIRSVVNTDPRTRRWKEEDKEVVIDVLTERADGM